MICKETINLEERTVALKLNLVAHQRTAEMKSRSHPEMTHSRFFRRGRGRSIKEKGTRL